MSKTQVETAERELREKLNAANGKRRERIVSFHGAIQAIREALGEDPYGWVGGATVCNSYGWRAYRTRVWAIRCGGTVWVGVEVVSATSGGTGLPWREGLRPETVQKSLAEFAEYVAKAKPVGLVQISERAARLLVYRNEKESRDRAWESVPSAMKTCEALVTVDDSLKAGNCAKETARVAKWFRAKGVPARALLDRLKARAPHLLPFGVRAVRVAMSRA